MNTACPIEHDRGFVMKLICLAHRLEQVAEQYFFAPKGLSMSTGRIIMCLHHRSITPTELAKALETKKSNVTQRISLLKKNGLVTLGSASSDRRRIHLELTDRGHALASELENIFQKNVENLEATLSDEQKISFISSLGVLNQSLNQFTQ